MKCFECWVWGLMFSAPIARFLSLDRNNLDFKHLSKYKNFIESPNGWRHDTHHNDSQHNYIEHNNTQHNEIENIYK
jgi:hypothetical protein